MREADRVESAPVPPPFLTALSPEDAAALREHAGVRSFRKGQALMYENQVPNEVLLLLRGRVKVGMTTEQGREIVLAFRGPGELVGELSAIDERPRAASVVSLEPVEALAIAHTDFLATLAGHPGLALALLRQLAVRLRDADKKRAGIATSGTLERVAERLVELMDRFGEDDGGAVRVALPITQDELAGWAGASLESAGRALHTMRSLGWIETGRREIRVVDQQALRHAADYVG